MALSRLFGFGRKPKPAQPAPATPRAFKPAVPQGIEAPEFELLDGVKAASPARGGFDPYNSGAFNRSKAWERTNRR